MYEDLIHFVRKLGINKGETIAELQRELRLDRTLWLLLEDEF